MDILPLSPFDLVTPYGSHGRYIDESVSGLHELEALKDIRASVSVLPFLYGHFLRSSVRALKSPPWT